MTVAVGVSVPKFDAAEKVSGHARYVDDLTRPGMIFGAIAQSPFAFARIRGYDLSAALAVPGVRAIVTGADLDRPRVGSFVKDETTMARDFVRYVGEPVAAVAADTLAAARLAAQLVEVDYEELTPVLDIDQALAADAPQVHPDLGAYTYTRKAGGDGNAFWSAEIVEGDTAAAWADCDVVVEGVYDTQAQYHAAIEPSGALAEVGIDGRLTVWSSAQSIFYLQGRLADELGLPMSRVRCIGPRIGGGFGGKNGVTVQTIAGALALRTGRPVKMTLTRAEDIEILRTRHPARLRIRTGARADGTILAREIEATLDAGAYCDESPAVMSFCVLMARGPYRIPNTVSRGRVVYTNKLKAGSFRGFGNPQASFAGESQIDELAARLGMDPLDLRRRNLMQPGDTWLGGQPVPSCLARETLEAAAAAWESDREHLPPPARGCRRGVGFASLAHISGLMGTSANVQLRPDGTVGLSTGVIDIGQGSDTVLAQICAEALQLPVENISYAAQDTDTSPYNWKTAASRVTYTAGRAVLAATHQVRDQILRHAAEMIECAPEDLELKPGGRVVVKGVEGMGVSFRDVAGRSFNGIGGPILGQNALAFDGPGFDPKRAIMDGFAFDNLGVYAFGCVAVAVDVDVQTGKVHPVGVWAAHDVGRAINPGLVEGQIQGAVAQGLGYALLEEVLWDEGRIINPSLVDYKVPGAHDLPDRIVPIILEDPEPDGPFGAKGVGEAGMVGVAAAVANAVANATGARLRRIPMTSERVLDALESGPDGA